MPRCCRNLKADHFSPFIDIRPDRARPGSCGGGKKKNLNVAFVQTTKAHQNLDHKPSIAPKLKLVTVPSSGCVGTNTLGLGNDLWRKTR